MQDIIDNALGWLDEQNTAFRSRTVTYSRGSSSVSVDAVLDGQDFGAELVDIGAIGWSGADFLIHPEAIVLDSVETLPQKQDRITTTVNGLSRIYEVLVPANGIPLFERIDNNRRLRIHTKLVV